MAAFSMPFKIPKVINYLQKTYLKNPENSENPKKKDCSKNFSYELIGCRRDKNGHQIVLARIINSPRGMFKIKATDLIFKHKNLLSQFHIDDVIKIVGIAATEKAPQIVKTLHTSYKYYAILAMLFGVILLTSQIMSSKLISLFGLTIVGGVISYPFTFVVGDIVTEVYGYKRARQLIWGAVFTHLIFLFFLKLSVLAPPSQYWSNQNAYSIILGAFPRIVFASFISYSVSEFLNSYMLAKFKIFSKGQNLPKRILCSACLGILVDTLLFVSIAYFGVLPSNELFSLFFVHFLIKLSCEFLIIPFTVIIIQKLKTAESIDIFDINTNFTPFSLDVTYGEVNNKFNAQL